MKQNLNEEVSRIKGMMGKIMTESFEGDVNEQNPLLRFAKNLISPEVKVLRRGMELRNVKSPAVRSLIQKFGTVSMTNFVKGTLRPFEDSMAIFVNDYKKLQNLKVPTGDKHDYVAYLNQQISDVRREMAVAVGKPLNLDYLYHKTDQLTTYVDNIIQSKQVNKQGIKILTDMKQTVINALDGIEDALGQIATRK